MRRTFLIDKNFAFQEGPWPMDLDTEVCQINCNLSNIYITTNSWVAIILYGKKNFSTFS